MAIPTDLPPLTSYDDLNRWARVEVLVEREIADRTRHLAETRVATIEDYRERFGYLAALRWVLQTGRDMEQQSEET